LPRQHDPNVLVGFDTADDAGVYKLSPDLALVQTVDFFTPIVDDPFTFGQIAAVNALSDVYAMGGRPISSLAMVCFPEKEDLQTLGQILAGGLSKMIEAGCTVIGGHSIRDEEIKFGYAVTGSVHPNRILANGGAKAGDVLVLTKALGTGVISTAIKQGKAKPAWIEAATKSMTTLNKLAAEAAEVGGDVHAATDITGFGFLGHAREIAVASKVSLRINSAKIPMLAGAVESVRGSMRACWPESQSRIRRMCGGVRAKPGRNNQDLAIRSANCGRFVACDLGERVRPVPSRLSGSGRRCEAVGEVLPQTDPLIMIV